MLILDHITASYKMLDGDIVAVDDISLDIEDNEIFGIAGESGCGKSTLLKVIYDIIEFPLQIDKGTVILSGIKNGAPFSYSTGEISKSWWSHISYIPQAAMSVLNPISRLKNQFLDSIPDEAKKKNGQDKFLREITQYLVDLNLSPDILESYPFQLSGGMRQRCIIALATFMQPKPDVVLADEPTTALDVVVQRGILMMLTKLQRQYKNTMILVSHDLGVHYQISDRMAIMYSGRLMEVGKTSDIFTNPQHPYTQLLINALPRVGDKSVRAGIAGKPPSLKSPPPGCRFADRCPRALDICHRAVPEYREIMSGRFTACHILNERGANSG
ncbi:MAG: ABC transporter ATP-binding protein [Oscillospiraceae bacterium]|nr:ABC transporter ATP-binding protein [Oscillospiraceae bacterium]